MKLLADLLHDSDPLSARYLCRIVSGRMRLGAASMTILDALAVALATKEERSAIERGFNISSDMGLVAHTLAKGGIEAVKAMHVRPGNPLRVMLAERLPTLEGILQRMGGSCAMEYKYDGVRMQAHIQADCIKLYSRRLEDISSHFPDVVSSLRESFRGTEAIVEGECVPVDTATDRLLPFQEVSHRRRKHGLDEAVKEYPVIGFLFDCIYLDGSDMTELPYLERRAALSRAFEIQGGLQLSQMKLVEGSEEATEFFQSALEAGCEGIMAKSLDESSGYRAGARGFHWIKFKKDYQSDLTDTVDLVVIGGFHGRGKRKGHYGALLMAVYDPAGSRYQSICKLGSGFDDAFLAEAPGLLNPYLHPHKPNDVDSRMEPDVWFQPAVVLEVLAAEISVSPTHTAASDHLQGDTGLALRFPRFTGRVRDDKGPEQASTSDELWSMYQMQKPPSD
ncbi:MAG: ATP-dependent DNA ligase, partial [Candidatus Methanomethylophilaceae archaeon]|nr:ATP-dependent DNA ligase [Candidatus Methanomethylophilaceae archaeon]